MTFARFYQSIRGYPPFHWQSELAEKVAETGSWPETLSLPTASGKTSVIDVWAWLRSEGKAPRRLFYVIDRRIVVDSAAEHAKRIPDIQTVTLRGGMYLDETWIRDPAKPVAVVTTVDQVGSRLLFRGYGVSPGTRSIHAGLVGNDSLLVVDEAHLSQAFLDVLAQIKKRHAITVVEMTATPRSGNTSIFEPALNDELLRKRHCAGKPARLHDTENLEADCAGEAEKFAKSAKVVGVVVNTVSAARRIFEQLRRRHETILLTGRIRPYDRDALLGRYLDRMRAGRPRANDQPLIVVATQTVEVGADLDFDALVTEAAALDALQQRFGRLNRLGELSETPAAIIRRKGGKEWVYGNALDATWKLLKTWAVKGHVDMSVDALRSHGTPAECRTPVSAAPLLTSIHLHKLVQTKRPRDGDVEIAPFLHGDEDNLDVQIVWRADLGTLSERWLDIVSLAPPTLREAMPVRIGDVRRWLNGREALLWQGPESELVSDARVGDTLIIPSSYGGADEFGWNPASQEPVSDIGDETARTPRRRLHLIPEIGPDLAELFETGDIGIRTRIAEKVGWLPSGEWIMPAPDLCVVSGAQLGSPSDDSASFGQREVTLRDHSADVAFVAERFARECGLPKVLVEDLRLAGELHDLGKADARFQLMLGAGETLLAKSRSATPLADYLRACRELGVERLPRHEVLSLAEDGIEQANDRELVRHLIGTHHGYGRGFFPHFVTDLDQFQWAEQFGRLRAQYGDWRLAYLEAILRLADWEASANPGAGATGGASASGFQLSARRVAREGGSSDAVELPGLAADSTLGALAAFGVLEASGGKLSWKRSGRSSHAVLHGFSEDSLVDCLIEQAARGSERAELCWADKVDTKLWRGVAASLAGTGSEDYVSALPTTPVNCTRLGGLKVLLEARKMRPTREQFREALFGPWLYADHANPLGLDPEAVRSGAFTSDDPRVLETVSVLGATWLALQAIPLFPEQLIWPCWEAPLSAPAARLLFASGILETESAEWLSSRGIYALYTSERVRDQGATREYLRRARTIQNLRNGLTP